MTRDNTTWAGVLVVGATLAASAGGAAVCAVPSGSHSTIQAAVDDATCSEIVLADQVFAESVVIGRDLALRGASSATTVVEGRISIVGSSTRVEVRDLTVDAGAPSVAGCHPVALDADGGAEASCSAVVVRNRDGEACLIFRDGFESGGTSSWSTVSP